MQDLSDDEANNKRPSILAKPDQPEPVIALTLTVIQGDGLVAKDKNILGQWTTSDPYVLVSCFPMGIAGPEIQLGKSPTIRYTLSPTWEQDFFIELPMKSITDDLQFQVTIMDWDEDLLAGMVQSDDDLMGVVTVPVPPNLYGRTTKSQSTKWYGVPATSASRASGRIQCTLAVTKSHKKRDDIARTVVQEPTGGPVLDQAQFCPDKEQKEKKSFFTKSNSPKKEKGKGKDPGGRRGMFGLKRSPSKMNMKDGDCDISKLKVIAHQPSSRNLMADNSNPAIAQAKFFGSRLSSRNLRADADESENGQKAALNQILAARNVQRNKDVDSSPTRRPLNRCVSTDSTSSSSSKMDDSSKKRSILGGALQKGASILNLGAAVNLVKHKKLIEDEDNDNNADEDENDGEKQERDDVNKQQDEELVAGYKPPKEGAGDIYAQAVAPMMRRGMRAQRSTRNLKRSRSNVSARTTGLDSSMASSRSNNDQQSSSHSRAGRLARSLSQSNKANSMRNLNAVADNSKASGKDKDKSGPPITGGRRGALTRSQSMSMGSGSSRTSGNGIARTSTRTISPVRLGTNSESLALIRSTIQKKPEDPSNTPLRRSASSVSSATSGVQSSAGSASPAAMERPKSHVPRSASVGSATSSASKKRSKSPVPKSPVPRSSVGSASPAAMERPMSHVPRSASVGSATSSASKRSKLPVPRSSLGSASPAASNSPVPRSSVCSINSTASKRTKSPVPRSSVGSVNPTASKRSKSPVPRSSMGSINTDASRASLTQLVLPIQPQPTEERSLSPSPRSQRKASLDLNREEEPLGKSSDHSISARHRGSRSQSNLDADNSKTVLGTYFGEDFKSVIKKSDSRGSLSKSNLDFKSEEEKETRSSDGGGRRGSAEHQSYTSNRDLTPHVQSSPRSVGENVDSESPPGLYVDGDGNEYYLSKNGVKYYKDPGSGGFYADGYGATGRQDGDFGFYEDAEGREYFLDENGVEHYKDEDNGGGDYGFYMDGGGRTYFLDVNGIEHFKEDDMEPDPDVAETGFFMDADGIDYYLDDKGIEYYQNMVNGEFYAHSYQECGRGQKLGRKDLPLKDQKQWEAHQKLKQ